MNANTLDLTEYTARSQTGYGSGNVGEMKMEKVITYLVLLLLLLCWLAVYQGVPALQGLLTIVSICGVALGMRCRRPMEGR